MATRIADILSLSPSEEELFARDAGKVKSLAEFFNESVDALKDSPTSDLLGHVVKIASEWSGTVKAFTKVVDYAITEHSSLVLGWLACTLAYRQAAEKAIQLQSRPASRLLFSADIIKSSITKLNLEHPSIMEGFTLDGATGHPFVRAADRALWIILDVAGYAEDERRTIIRAVRSSFTAQMQELLTGEKGEKFAAFRRWLHLGTEDGRVFASLAKHIEQIRAELEDSPALGIEPFTVDQVYIATECGQLPWHKIRGDLAARIQPVDAFDETSARRQDLMQGVLDLMRDPNYDDAIVVMGAPGAGKSTFTKKLAVRLHAEGFLPIRVPLQHLRVDMDLFDAVHDVLKRFYSAEFQSSVLRDKVFAETLPIGSIEISSYVFIFDGWDEINLAADEGFQQRVNRLLDRLRQTLFDQNQGTVRAILTGRPSQAIARSGFFRDHTMVLTIRPLNPDDLERYVNRILKALENPLSGPAIENWKPSHIRHYEPALTRYRREFPAAVTLDVLGQPLLAHLAIRLLANFEAVEELIERPTTLYRHLTDLTCKSAGRAKTSDSGRGRTVDIPSEDLRPLLHGTALAVTAFGTEAIPEDELRERLNTLGIGDLTQITHGDQPLTNLMISFFFKQVTEHSGCEFLHKSLREYLAAEAIVEVLKNYGRLSKEAPLEKPVEHYWKDFPLEDNRFWLTRKLGEIMAGQWLSASIVEHIRALLEWEINRTLHPAEVPTDKIAGIPTSPLGFEAWEIVRDGLADLWDWWGEGVHLRPQPTRTLRDWKIDVLPYVFELMQRAMRRDNHNQRLPPRPLRTVTVDAHLGYGLFQLTAFVHGLMADAKGWGEWVRQAAPEGAWNLAPAMSRRRYQMVVESGGQRFVVFAPSGPSNVYFRNYAARINAAGVAPPSFAEVDFPGMTYMHAVFLKGNDLQGLDFDRANLSTSMLAGAAMVQSSLRGVDLTFTELNNTAFILADLTGADVANSNFQKAYLDKSDLSDLRRGEIPRRAGG